MKKLLSFTSLLLCGLFLSAQVIQQFPAMEDFEGSANPGSHDFILDWDDDWVVADAPSNQNSPITNGHNSYDFVYVYSSSEQIVADLKTWAFELEYTDHARLSFWMANPDWAGDVDMLKIGFRYGDSDAWTFLYTISASHDSWTKFEYDLPVGHDMQICFRAETNRGYGVYLDDIKVEIPDYPVVSEFPWKWDFDNGLDVWSQYYTGLYVPWTTVRGNYNPDDESNINFQAYENNDYNAIFYNEDDDDAWLISPVFKLGNADSATLSFIYALEPWDSDFDEIEVYYRNSQSGTWDLLFHSEESANNDWENVKLALPDLTDNYQIAFRATGHYGYGAIFDWPEVKAWFSTGVNDIASENAKFSVYPNPATDYIFVDREGNDEIFIYNAFGSLVKSSRENRISVSDLASGIYVVKTSEGSVKFVK